MAGKPPAADALRLILAVVPWIVDHPGTPVADVAERFGKTEEQLLKAINILSFVGLPPYSPDVLIEMRIDEGRIWIDFAEYFSRPLRLSTRQALSLLSSADGLLSVPGSEAGGSLATAFAKIAAVVGADAGGLDVDLGEASTDVLEQLRRSTEAETEVKMEYYSFGRNETTARLVSPWRVYADGGEWYVQGWCQLADGERTFRVDRISTLEDTGTASTHPAADHHEGEDGASPVRYRATGGEHVIVLKLKPNARWVIESLPCLEVELHDSGETTVTLAVSAIPWLERLLLQLGEDAMVVDSTIENADQLRPDAAVRILASYSK